MEIVPIKILTDSAGNATVYSPRRVKGIAKQTFLDIGDLTDGGVDLVVTGEDSGAPIISETNMSGDTLTAATANAYLYQERIKIVVTDGDDTKSGELYVAVADS